MKLIPFMCHQSGLSFLQEAAIDGDATDNYGKADFWIININKSGQLNWQKKYGGTLGDRAYSIKKTKDKGFIVAGDSYSNNGQVTGHHGSTSFNDFWIIKLDSAGTFLQGQSYGGSIGDNAFSVIELHNGVYVATGWCNSNDGDVTGHHGTNNSPSDFWIIKIAEAVPIVTENLFSLSTYKSVSLNVIQARWH